jgi:GNAT superfamily N-acetyltransferase
LQGVHSVELTAADESTLQRFFDANPLYFVAIHGEPAHPGEAHEAIHATLPAGWPFTKKWLIGWLDAGGSLVAIANIVSDLLAAGVWHVGLFIVATHRHGSGDALVLYRSLETWASAHGAKWLRLGVVRGNERAERFWEKHGFVETRTREMVMGPRTNTVRVMVKPLTNEPLERYLALVPRDRPGNIDAA